MRTVPRIALFTPINLVFIQYGIFGLQTAVAFLRATSAGLIRKITWEPLHLPAWTAPSISSSPAVSNEACFLQTPTSAWIQWLEYINYFKNEHKPNVSQFFQRFPNFSSILLTGGGLFGELNHYLINSGKHKPASPITWEFTCACFAEGKSNPGCRK